MIGLLAMAAIAVVVGPDPRCGARVGFHQPLHGVVSTPEMAARVAEIYLTAVYGADVIGKELPLKVGISREVWHVEGTHRSTFWRPNFVGGLAEIEICQSTGQVLRIVHGK